MKYDDFASLIQLGVGLNVGTAVLQLYAEIGLQPIVRTLDRIKRLAKDNTTVHDQCGEELDLIEGQFEVFRIRLFNQYRFSLIINAVAALALVAILIFISFAAESEISPELGVLFSALAILPAPVTLGVLWRNASTALTPLKNSASALQEKALATSAS